MTKLETENIGPRYRGIKTTLTTYNKAPITGDWQATSDAAVAVTKLERMHFLAGFLGLLQDIERRLDDLG
jgi:hypothetical protein